MKLSRNRLKAGVLNFYYGEFKTWKFIMSEGLHASFTVFLSLICLIITPIVLPWKLVLEIILFAKSKTDESLVDKFLTDPKEMSKRIMINREKKQ